MTRPELAAFVDQVGLFGERSGLPATAGRMLGYLLICEPAVQSAGDLALALSTTSGSISTNSRLLEQIGMIERVPVRGRRGVFVRVTEDAWGRMFHRQLESTHEFGEVLEAGMRAAGDPGPDHRLAQARDFYRFLGAEMPALVERWRRTAGRSP